MAPKGRSRQNSDLTGTNIKVIKRKRYDDYYYIMPDGKPVPLVDENGTKATRAEAIEAAHQLNNIYRKSGELVQSVINRKETPKTAKVLDSFNKVLDLALEKKAKPFRVSPETLKEKLYKVEQYRREWGERSISSFTTADISAFLDKQAAHPYIKHRQLLNDLFKFAIQRGFINQNPVENTEVKSEPKRKKQRHTLEGYLKIYEAAPDWLKRAMQIALLSLQRRADLVGLHRDMVDMQERTITILQSKTKNYEKPVFIKIKMGEELYSAVKNCFNSGIPCPYLIHYRPKRMTTEQRKAKVHPFAVTLDHLSKSFSEVRDQCGAYDHIPNTQRPSLHDLRALGSYLYEKAGYPLDYIQALDGHATPEMTQRYIDGHEAKKPALVSAELSLKLL